MANRLAKLPDRPEDEGPDEDYWEVHGTLESFYVTRETAERVLAQIGRRWPPRWIRFTDLHGGRVRIRSSRIHSVQECTREHRKAERAFRRARREEEKGDRRPWEEDDWWW